MDFYNAEKKAVSSGMEFDWELYLSSNSLEKTFQDNESIYLTHATRFCQEVRSFVVEWLNSIRIHLSSPAFDDVEFWLDSTSDTFLLSKCFSSIDFGQLNKTFVKLLADSVWTEFLYMLNPGQIISNTIDELEQLANSRADVVFGLSQSETLSAIKLWKEMLLNSSGEHASDDDEDSTDDDDFEGDEDETDSSIQYVFFRSDFPLLGVVARCFLASLSGERNSLESPASIGCLLPGDVPRYDHIIIDEAQDFTFAELQLACSLVEPNRHAVTISGDRFQRMDWRSGFSSIESISKGKRYSVNINYRQTIEICKLVQKLADILFGTNEVHLGEGNRHGPSPEWLVESDFNRTMLLADKAIAKLFSEQDSPYISVIMVGYEVKHFKKAEKQLSKLLDKHPVYIEWLKDGRFVESGRVCLADVPTVKGLEFDSVVVIVSETACDMLESDSLDSRVMKNQMYVACSRAKDQLTVISHRSPSFLSELLTQG